MEAWLARAHLDLVPLLGITKDSPRVEAFIVFGFELGKVVESKRTRPPISTRGR